MMASVLKDTGLYWQPLGGNNIDQISGHSYRYTNVSKSKGKTERETILIDLGKFDNHQALGIKNSAAAVPDVRIFLEDAKKLPKALFLTHSHPDHLNGIIHYLKNGYKLPPLYAGKYTFMILYDLLTEFKIPRKMWPKMHTITCGDVIKLSTMEIEVVPASHTCFDSFGFIIRNGKVTVYHTGDMKLDQSTCFRKPTNLKRIAELAKDIDYVVADFYGIDSDGMAVREVDTYKRLVKIIKKSRKRKVFIPVYPTHPEMYLMAFMAALKCKKNVIFYGNTDFFTYLKMIIEYGISFEQMAGSRIKVSYAHNPEDIAEMNNNFVVIGTYNDINPVFGTNSRNSIGIITAATFFNPLKGQFNLHNIKFVTVEDFPELQGYGHGFFGDYEKLNSLFVKKPVFIPTHCPVFMIDDVRELAEFAGMRIIPSTPKNNQIYLLKKRVIKLVSSLPAKWMVVIYNTEDNAYMTEVFQKPTSGQGFLKRTVSRRRCMRKFKAYLLKRKKAISNN